MNIRETSFWKQIEPIFAENPGAEYFPSRSAYGRRVCDYAAFRDRLRQAMKRAVRNDRHVFLLLMEIQQHCDVAPGGSGAAAGQLLLGRVAGCLRSGDSLCTLESGRMAILVEGARAPGVLRTVTGKIQSAVTRPLRTESAQLSLRPCFGAGVFPADAIDEDKLWRRAHAALDAAVRSSPDALQFSPVAAGHAAMERFELNKALYKALRKREFRLVYQPVFTMDGTHVTGAEALLRWQHPQRGLLRPEAFFASLEESGLIIPVGEWILNEACTMVARMSGEGATPLRVSVNVSARQLADSGFVLAVVDALYDSGIDARLLQLEVSEHVIARDLHTAQRVLQELGEAGVGVVIDQYGADRLAVADLIRLPATAVKLDRSRVAGLPGDSLSRAIVSGTAALARGSGKAVAAAGVEQHPQLQLLAQMGLAEVQGTLLSQPQTALGLMSRLRA